MNILSTILTKTPLSCHELLYLIVYLVYLNTISDMLVLTLDEPLI